MNFNEAELMEMLSMQKELDAYIMDKQNIEYDENVVSKVEIALFVELGEFLNELPRNFKYWKPNAENNRHNALIEYVDCLHFAMSLHNYYCHSYTFEMEDIQDLNSTIFAITTSLFLEGGDLLGRLLLLGGIVGFNWSEVYNTYIEKNKVNYERQVTNEAYINKDREIGN